MKKDEIILKLKVAEEELRKHGVLHAALFGSVARGEEHDGSDIDIMVDLDPEIVKGMFKYAGVKNLVADMFDVPVDVVDRESMKSNVRPKAVADAIYAF